MTGKRKYIPDGDEEKIKHKEHRHLCIEGVYAGVLLPCVHGR